MCVYAPGSLSIEKGAIVVKDDVRAHCAHQTWFRVQEMGLGKGFR
jgi:hypothetical protein